MKILFIAHEKSDGGATRALLEIISDLLKQEDVKIIVWVPFCEGEIIDELRKINVRVISKKFYFWNIPILQKGKKARNFVQRIMLLRNNIVIKELQRIVRSEGVDVIHSNTSIMNVGQTLSKKTGIPHVWHVREFAYQKEMNRNFVLSERKVKAEFQKSNVVVCSSNSICDFYEKKYDLNNAITVYDGVKDNSMIINKAYSKVGLNLLITGNVSKQKGQIEAIKSVEKLVQEGYKDIVLYVAGDGDIDEIRTVIKRGNLEENVKLLGNVTKMKSLRSSMDIELVCSEGEGFGRVTVEAMMAQMPVIGSNRGATPELICDGKNGYVYEKGNIRQLCDIIMKFYFDRELLEKMGKDACSYAEKKYNYGRLIKQLVELYKGIIQ